VSGIAFGRLRTRSSWNYLENSSNKQFLTICVYRIYVAEMYCLHFGICIHQSKSSPFCSERRPCSRWLLNDKIRTTKLSRFRSVQPRGPVELLPPTVRQPSIADTDSVLCALEDRSWHMKHYYSASMIVAFKL